MREKENLHSALMALMTSHERALEDLRVKQDKDQSGIGARRCLEDATACVLGASEEHGDAFDRQ